MKPPYNITATILKLTTSISEKLGEVKAYYLDKPTPNLRKKNKIKTIHASLQIEGNTLSEEQITALLENKRIIGPKEDILEVLNAVKVYEKIHEFSAFSEKSFKKAHTILMNSLIENAGVYRKKSVGIVHGKEIAHIAPPAGNVPYLMKDLFNYIKRNEDPILIKSCVFHYEMVFIHPFLDGNGRMARLWQTIILMNEYPVFEYLPFESLISQTQDDYYKALKLSDQKANATAFIEYLLNVIDNSLSELLQSNIKKLTSKERLEYIANTEMDNFSRKDYMTIFKNISTATASRDLKKGVETGILKITGKKNQTRYILFKNNKLKN